MLGQPLMLSALQPADRRMTLVAASLLSLLCAYYMINLPIFTALMNTDDSLIVTRTSCLVACEAFWCRPLDPS